MSIEVQCPKCGRAYVLADNLAGGRVRCVECRMAFDLPETTLLTLDEMIAGPGKARSRRRGGRLLVGSLAGLLLLSAAIVAATALPAARRARAEVNRALRRQAIERLAWALLDYARDHGERLPYDPRGELHSLALLYPDYVASPDAFVPPQVGEGPAPVAGRFPRDTALSAAPCAYRYFHETAADPPAPDAPVLAEPAAGRMGEGGYVVRADGAAAWRDDLAAPEQHATSH